MHIYKTMYICIVYWLDVRSMWSIMYKIQYYRTKRSGPYWIYLPIIN